MKYKRDQIKKDCQVNFVHLKLYLIYKPNTKKSILENMMLFKYILNITVTLILISGKVYSQKTLKKLLNMNLVVIMKVNLKMAKDTG